MTATGLPFVFEATGVFAPTWRMTTEGLVTHGQIFEGRDSNDAFAMILSTFALTLVVGLYTLSLTRARRSAQRVTIVQAWHLRQLLPNEPPRD